MRGSNRQRGSVRRGRAIVVLAMVALLLLVALGGVGVGGAAASDYHGTITAGGSSVPVTLSSSGDTGYLTFTGTSGERVFIKAVTGTLSGFGIYSVSLLNPSSTTIGSATIFSNSTKFIDTTTLGSSGTYTIEISPFSTTTGTTTITLSDVSSDSSGSITAGGSPVGVTLSSAGQNGTLTFSGTSGQRVFVTATTGSLSGTGTPAVVVNLLSPTNANLGSTSVITSSLSKYIDTTALSSTGTYTVQVDPQDDATGTTTITLYSVAADATTATAIDAVPLTVSLAVGQNAALPFRGASGQVVDFDRNDISIGSATYKILNPDGSTLSSSGVQGTGDNTMTATLGTTGVFTLVVDPFDDASGSATVTLSISGDAPLAAASFTSCGTTPVFRAEPVSGSGSTYQFQVASDSGFSTVVSDSGAVPATNTFSPPAGTLTNGQTYYWRWKTGSGSWSSGRSFSIDQSHLGADGSPMWSDGPLAVNEVNGNLLVSLPGPQYPTAVGAMGASVSYNSQDTTDRGLGAGWLLDSGGAADAPVELLDHNLLTSNRIDAVEAFSSDGSSRCFTHVGQTTTYTSGPGDGTLLTKNADGSWTYTQRRHGRELRRRRRRDRPRPAHQSGIDERQRRTGALTYRLLDQRPVQGHEHHRRIGSHRHLYLAQPRPVRLLHRDRVRHRPGRGDVEVHRRRR